MFYCVKDNYQTLISIDSKIMLATAIF